MNLRLVLRPLHVQCITRRPQVPSSSPTVSQNRWLIRAAVQVSTVCTPQTRRNREARSDLTWMLEDQCLRGHCGAEAFLDVVLGKALLHGFHLTEEIPPLLHILHPEPLALATAPLPGESALDVHLQ